MSERLSNLKNNIGVIPKSRLQLSRQRVNLNCQEIKDLLYGKGNFNNYVKPYIDFINNNQHIFSHHNIENHSLSEQRKEAAKMMFALKKFWKLDLINQPIRVVFLIYAIGMFDGGMCTKSLLQYFLYAKSLLLYQSNPKHLEFYNRAMNGQDIGCFSLTQFHHGSYSKGIETLAIYDKHTDEFILTTQGTKGMKFWIGALAELANVTLIWANLIIDGKSQGPHPFYLPIRCQKTHKVLPGVIIGDCGPKRGLNYIDNGFLMLNEVRIPRQNLLGKFGSVNEKGQYVSLVKDWNMRFGLHMSALSAGRGFLSIATNTTSLNALVIALRYAHSRKQFQNNTKTDQIAIIDYPLTKIRLIPQIARHIVQIPAGIHLATIYTSDQQLLKNEHYVNEMHAISAAVKARFTWNTINAAIQSRTILGGHGFSNLSRIPSIVDDIQLNATWEGDNTVLLQQTSKYLMKVIAKKTKTKMLDLTFIHNTPNVELQKIEEKLRDINNVELLLKDLLRTKYSIARQKMTELRQLHSDKEESQYHFHPQAGNSLALTFADYYTFTVAKANVLQSKCTEVRRFLEDCLFLWAFVVLEKERYGSHDFRRALQREIMGLCEELVDRSVVVTDALAPSSFVIGSPFADFYGEGFKEYINILYTKQGTFARSNYYQDIKAALLG